MLVLVSIKKFMLLSKAKKASFIGAWDLDVVFSNYRVHLGIMIYTRIPVFLQLWVHHVNNIVSNRISS